MGLVELLLLPLTLSSLGSTKVESASTEKHFALPSNCPNRCGNISIEYPFGIGHDCYRAGFNLTCTNHTDQPPRLSLGDGVLEVTRIDLDTGTVYVKTPVVTMGVDQESINVPLIDLQNWPYSFTSLEQEIQNFYTIDTYNRLYVSGCSVVADLVDPTTNNTIGTCITRCTSNGKHCYRSQSFALTCNTTFNPPILFFKDNYIVRNISLEEGQLEFSAPNRTTDSSYIDDNYNYFDETGPFTPLEQLSTFSWVIESQTCEEASKNMTTFACVDKNSSCVDVPKTSTKDIQGYRCKCHNGYQGNPYIANGCKGTQKPKSSLSCRQQNYLSKC
ncbi:hypothetical protein MUK42_27489 [Musa troglodytarum]|uniref:Wall-associated receptor kinase galacturonan-binding domain-containing protein n=1 Tax=Musa troglodytarum TaxID=320322 RepID=A0A9E7JPI0_9LILI|nr:hypothetical protein MUK42_27489 [Musa troglodytarum]